jgi:PAS domain S-box-containing protein
VLDPALAIASLASVLFGTWLLQRWSTNPTSWFLSSVAVASLAVATYPVRETQPLLGSMFFLYSGLGPVLIGAGVLALVGRRVPRLLLPCFVVYCLGRSGLHLAGMPQLAGLLAIGPLLVLGWAAAFLLRGTQQGANSRAQRVLGPALLFTFALSVVSIGLFYGSYFGGPVLGGPGADASGALPGPPLPILILWMIGGPVLLTIQLWALAEHRANTQRAARDALEQTIAERTAELAQSEERYRTVSELSSDFSFSLRIDPEHGLQREWVTEAFERITGLPPERLDGDQLAALMYGDAGRNGWHAEPLTGQNTRERPGAIRYRIVRPDGNVRWVDLKLRAETDAMGVSRLFGVAQDVTEAQRSQEVRLELERQVEAAQRVESLGMLAGGIAHDFNNLLAVILGNTRLLQEELPAESAASKLVRIRSATEHAMRLTEQMLTFSGKAAVSLSAIELSSLIADLSDLLEASVGADCQIAFDLGDDLVVEGDSTRLSQVILNLLTNAYEALEGGCGNVWIRTGRDVFDAQQLSTTSGASQNAPGEYVWLEVADDGAGMDTTTRRRIFEPFFTTKFSGRGLGLASVLGIIRAHNGLVDLDSETRGGTRIRVLLPPSTEEPALRLAPTPVDGIPKRVLVVDDDEAVLELAGEFLRRAGYEFHLASGGPEAIELFGKKHAEIDVVVLDLTMPDLDGHEVLRELRKIRSGVPVVLATGHSRNTADAGMPDDEAHAFLSKPYEPEELLAAIRTASSIAQR